MTARRRAFAAAFAALAVVLATKLAVGLPLGAHPLLAPEGELDGAYYVHFARQVAAGDLWLMGPGSHFGEPPAPFFLAPLYIYALALFLKVGGSLAAARAIQLVLGAAGVWLVALTARRWWGSRAGWVSGALATGCGLFTFYESLILQAALDPFLTSLDLYTLTLALQNGRRRDWGAAGLAMGLHALNRPNMLLVVAGLATAVAIRHLRPRRGVMAPAVFALAAATAIAPATLRNLRASGQFVLVSSHGGLNFLIGNGPEADGTWVRVMGIEPSIRGQWLDAPRVAESAAGRPLTQREASALFAGRAWDWIAGHPHAEAWLLARKTWYALSGVFLTLNHSFPFFARDAGSALGWLPIGPVVFVPLGLIGLIVARPSRAGFGVWALFAPLAILSVVVFFVAARYRLPYQVALLAAAGGGVSWLYEARSRGARELAAAMVIAVAGFVVVVLPTGLDDGRAEERARMGLFELERGRLQEGEAWISRAVERHGFPGVVHLRAGRLHESAGRFSEALEHYRRALVIDRDQPELRVAAGRVLIAMGRPDDGVAELDRVPDGVLNDSIAREYERAGLALVMQGSHEQAAEVLAKATMRSPDVPSIHLNLAVALGMAGRRDEARREAEEALRLDPNYTKARDLLRTLR